VEQTSGVATNLLTSTRRPSPIIPPHLELHHLLRTAINVLGTYILLIARKKRFETLGNPPFELRTSLQQKMTKFILVAGGVIS
jgi:hypothetical protein